MTVAEPDTPSVILAAIAWIEALLTGTFAVAAGTVAVAGIGFGLLTGWIDLRRAGQAVLGCFILFGAPTVARELAGLARIAAPTSAEVPAAEAPVPPAPRDLPAPTNPFDPYTGAKVPE